MPRIQTGSDFLIVLVIVLGIIYAASTVYKDIKKGHIMKYVVRLVFTLIVIAVLKKLSPSMPQIIVAILFVVGMAGALPAMFGSMIGGALNSGGGQIHEGVNTTSQEKRCPRCGATVNPHSYHSCNQ